MATDAYELYATMRNKPSFNKAVAEEIANYIKGHHPKGNLYPNWKVGVGDDSKVEGSLTFHSWECPSNVSAHETISYFTDVKYVVKVNSDTENTSKRIFLFLLPGERGD